MFKRQPWMQRAGEFPRSDTEYFELLTRAVFSAGLGPRVVESRWDGIRGAMRDLEPAAVAAMTAEDVNDVLTDPGIIRNRRKVEAVVSNAGAFLDTVEEHGTFHEFLQTLSDEHDFAGMADMLGKTFAHLGRTSAGLFLFSAGWRGPDFAAPPEGDETGGKEAQERIAAG